MSTQWTIGHDYSTEYATESEAKAVVEATGHGYLVCWVRDFDGRCRSCNMVVFHDGVWEGVYIHG